MWEYEASTKKECELSQGRLREGTPEKQREGKDHLTGYRPREQEGKRRPREVGRLENSYGDIAVGSNRKKEVVVSVSRRRSQTDLTTREDEKSLKGDSAENMNLVRGKIQTNSHDPAKSAVGYRQSSGKAPGSMVDQMRSMMRNQDQQTIWKQAPFLDRKPEKDQLRQLRSQELELRGKNDPDAKAELQEIRLKKQQLQRILTEKEGQERRLRLILQKAREEAQKREEEDWEWPRRRFFAEQEYQTADGDGEDPVDGAEIPEEDSEEDPVKNDD